ncbi:hypothetical protein AURDEDRAFT_173676 [Auricularia subglabra TFB-10046 SS5]|nr:hypothetical protein AURDEDRAFT_173676 [Auricularia subglabra TFB-10046 SS5]
MAMYGPNPLQVSFRATPYGSVRAEVRGGSGCKVNANVIADAAGNLDLELTTVVFPPGMFVGGYIGPVRVPVWPHGPGAELYLASGFEWELLLHRPIYGDAPALLEARLLPPPPFAQIPLPWTPPPQYQHVAADAGDEFKNALSRFERALVQARAKECVAHILLKQNLAHEIKDAAQRLDSIARELSALSLPENEAAGSPGPDSTVAELSDD